MFQLHAVKALVAREVKGAFESPTAYVALFVFYLLTGYLFATPLFLVGQAQVKGLADTVPLLFTFIVPALTMGLLAEELKTGTFESLATLPLEDWDIVLGKFLGFAVLILVTVAGLSFFAAAACALVRPPVGLDWGETFGILAGFGLLGLMFGAIGLFASSLGKNQIVAFVTAFLMCFALFMAGKLSGFAPGALSRIVEFVGVDSHIDNLAKGVLDGRDLLYFASVTFYFLYMTVQRLQTRRF